MDRFRVEYAKSRYLGYMHDGEFLGGGITIQLEDAVATFFDTASTYMFHTDTEGYTVPRPGRYRVSVAAYPYQADTTVTLTLFKGAEGVAASANLTDLIGVFDLTGDAGRTVEVTTFLKPGDVVSPSVADLRYRPGRTLTTSCPTKMCATTRAKASRSNGCRLRVPWSTLGRRRARGCCSAISPWSTATYSSSRLLTNTFSISRRISRP